MFKTCYACLLWIGCLVFIEKSFSLLCPCRDINVEDLISPTDNVSSLSNSSSVFSDEEMNTVLQMRLALSDYRLPNSLVPFHYDLQLQPFLDPEYNYTFVGNITVWFVCVESTTVITLHAHELDIDDVLVVSVDENDVPEVMNITFDLFRQFLIIELDDSLKENVSYGVKILYAGNLRNASSAFQGLVFAQYLMPDNSTRSMAASHFEPVYARWAFPCFDEPAFKATFKVSIVRRVDMTSLTNMPLKESRPSDDGWVVDEFHKSVPMSTYTVAFAVSHFGYTSTKVDNVLIRVWSRKELVNSTLMALEYAPRFLQFFARHLNISYPLSKLDVIAIPNILFGAMENWGLITFSEKILLIDEESSPRKKEMMVSFLAHEIAHQWFGNLVTMKWWNDIWLNEGFTTYMERLAQSKFIENGNFPNHLINQDYMVETYLQPFKFTTSRYYHPLSFSELTITEIPRVFTGLIYQRGAATARMMELTFGADDFNKGLLKYLADYQYQTVEQDDLWEVLGEIIRDEHGSDVKTIMDTWTLQRGLPLVTVIRNYTHNFAYVKQAPFKTSYDRQNVTNTDNHRWEIPLTFTSASNRNFEDIRPRKWLRQTDDYVLVTAEEGIPPSDEWLIFNLQVAGYYLVNYDNRNWKMLIRQLHKDHTKIPYLDRAYILSSLDTFMQNGVVSPSLALSATEYLHLETREIVMYKALTMLLNIQSLLQPTVHAHKFERYVHPILRSAWQRFFKNITDKGSMDKVNTDLNHALVLLSCRVELPECRDLSIQALHSLQSRPQDFTLLPVFNAVGSLRVLCSGVQATGPAEWNFIWNYYRRTVIDGAPWQLPKVIEQSQINQVLACSDKSQILHWFLEKSLDHKKMGLDEWLAVYNIQLVANRGYFQRILAFDFIANNWNTYIERFNMTTHILDIFASSLTTQRELDALKQLVACSPPDSLELSNFRRTLRNAEEHLEVVESRVPPVVDWLEKKAAATHTLEDFL